MGILVQVTGWDAKPWATMFRALAPERPVFTSVDDSNAAAIRYAMVWKPTPGLLGQLPDLAVIFNLGAGVDAILADPTVPAHIPIVRGVDANLTMRMVEWVTLHVLLHHRQMPFYQAGQAAARWVERPQAAAHEVTVGILGLGTLGTAAAQVLGALGFRLAGWSRTPRQVPGVACHAGGTGLGAFLGVTDILVCLLPLTAETRGILNRDLFRKLKRTGPLGAPVVINAGRGGHQVEADILAALDDGTLHGVSLDVFEVEPLPSSSPLWRHPKAILTPHNAADSDPRAICAHVLARIADFEAGRPLAPLVDRSRGY